MKYHKLISISLSVIGTIALCYYLLLCLLYGINNIVFSWTFLCLGCCFLMLSIWEIRNKKHLLSLFPKPIRIFVITFLVLGITFFGFVEGSIIATGSKPSDKQANTVIVLGAQLNGSSISRLLRYRLDAALSFYKQYPNTTIIVSGGQGPGEHQSEASAMKAYLIQHGIAASQIVVEEESRNTDENFAYSKKQLKNDTHVSVITNDFHMYRAKLLCEQNGLTCSLYPARSDLDLAPNFYFREFFGVIKDQYLTFLK